MTSTDVGKKYAQILRSTDFKNWADQLMDKSERLKEIGWSNIGRRTILYLYLLYRDTYGNIKGDIDDEFVRLIDDSRINIGDDGLILGTQYMYEDVPINDYILLLDNSLVYLDIPTVDHLESEYIPQLRNLEQILISPTDELRRQSNISYVSYGTVPKDIKAKVLMAVPLYR